MTLQLVQHWARGVGEGTWVGWADGGSDSVWPMQSGYMAGFPCQATQEGSMPITELGIGFLPF